MPPPRDGAPLAEGAEEGQGASDDGEGGDALDLRGVSLDKSDETPLPSDLPERPKKLTVRLSTLNHDRAVQLRDHYGVGSVNDAVNIAVAVASAALKPAS